MSDGEIDLYCLGCGYNLRGLAGDPIRCPECGRQSPRYLLEVGDAQAQRYSKYMLGVLALSAWLSAVLFGWAILAQLWAAFRGGTRPSQLTVTMSTLALLIILVNLVRFRGVCRARQGWLSAFCFYHSGIYAICAGFSAVAILLYRATVVLAAALPGLYEFAAVFLLLYVGLVSLILLYGKVLAPMHLRLVSRLAPFQIATARALAELDRRDDPPARREPQRRRDQQLSD